jgi:large subunit ribosomal protein L33
MAKKGDRDHIKLVSNDCPGVVYHTKKNKRNDPDRIELRKYCPKTRSVQVFRETR